MIRAVPFTYRRRTDSAGDAVIHAEGDVGAAAGFALRWNWAGSVPFAQPIESIWFGPGADGKRHVLAARRLELSSGASTLEVDGLVVDEDISSDEALSAGLADLRPGGRSVQTTRAGPEDSDRFREVAMAVQQAITNDGSPVLLLGESPTLVSGAVQQVIAELQRLDAPCTCFFSTLQTDFDPTLHFAGAVKGLTDFSTFPHDTRVFDLESLMTLPARVTVPLQRAGTVATVEAKAAVAIQRCPACGGERVITHEFEVRQSSPARRRRWWRWLWRHESAGTEPNPTLHLREYSCEECGGEFSSLDALVAVFTGPRRAGVTSLIAGLGTTTAPNPRDTLLPASSTWRELVHSRGLRRQQTSRAYEMLTLDRQTWLIVDDGGHPSATDRLARVAGKQPSGVAVVCVDVSQFRNGLRAQDRVGFPRECVDLTQHCIASLEHAPGWRTVVVLTKMDRLGEVLTWPTDHESQREFLRSEGLGPLADLCQASDRVQTLFVGRRDGRDTGPPEINVSELHAILQSSARGTK